MKNWFLLALLVILGSTLVSAQKIEREWVDLALPSGTLWASDPEDEFYSYTEAIDKFGVNMPTKWQWEELINSCVATELDNHRMEMRGKNGATIIIPLRGWVMKNGKTQQTDIGYYWTYTNFDKRNAWHVIVSHFFGKDDLQWTYMSYKMSILLVNK